MTILHDYRMKHTAKYATALLLLCLASCTPYRAAYNSARSEQITELRHAVDSLQQRAATTLRDTLQLRDTLRVTEQRRGDTVYITTARTLYRDRVVTLHDTVTQTRYITRRDTLRAVTTAATTTTVTKLRVSAAQLCALMLIVSCAAMALLYILRKKL